MVTPGPALSSRARCCLKLQAPAATVITREELVKAKPSSQLGAGALLTTPVQTCTLGSNPGEQLALICLVLPDVWF